VEIEALHSVDDEAHPGPLQGEVLKRQPGVERMDGIRLAVPLEDLVRDDDTEQRRLRAPRLVPFHEQVEEPVPVTLVPAGVDEPPFLFVVGGGRPARSEEHTSELQSRENLVCRLLLEKKKK